jgi:putative tricarboxylic transport membrane protein
MPDLTRKHPPDFYASIVLFVLAMAVAQGAYRLGLGELRAPGPGFAYFWASVLLALLSLRLFWRSLKSTASPGEPLWRGQNWKSAVFVFVALIAYALALETVGYIVVTFVFTAVLFRILADDRPRWLAVLGGAAATAIFTYVVFDRMFAVQLPKGLIGFI